MALTHCCCADAPPTPHHVDRNRCAHVGCHRKFHRLRLTDVKHALTRHYCSVCQNVYCHQHTQFSPHGSYGSCGMESKCICETCFFQLPRATQVRSSNQYLIPQYAGPALSRAFPACNWRMGQAAMPRNASTKLGGPFHIVAAQLGNLTPALCHAGALAAGQQAGQVRQ